MTRLKLGIAGCGRIAELVHLHNIRRLPGVELAAIADNDAGRLERARRLAPGAKAFADHRELMAWDGVEAVMICLPNALHAEAAVSALEADKHVYLEKPLAASLEDGRRVLEAARGADAVSMIGFNFRFHALYAALRRAVGAGRLGNIAEARTVLSTAPYELPAWKRSLSAGGGVLADLASHHIDLARFVLGREVEWARAEVSSVRSEADSATLELGLEGGVVVRSSFASSTVNEDRFEVRGESGRLALERYRGWRLEGDGLLASLRAAPGALRKLLSPSHEASYLAALEHFVASARSKTAPSPSMEDGYRSLEAVKAAEESARTGRAVRISEIHESPARQ